MTKEIIGQVIWDQIDRIEPIYVEQDLDIVELNNIRQFLTHNNMRNDRIQYCKQAVHNLATEMLNEEIHRVGHQYIGKAYSDFPVWLQNIVKISQGKMQ